MGNSRCELMAWEYKLAPFDSAAEEMKKKLEHSLVRRYQRILYGMFWSLWFYCLSRSTIGA